MAVASVLNWKSGRRRPLMLLFTRMCHDKQTANSIFHSTTAAFVSSDVDIDRVIRLSRIDATHGGGSAG